MKQTGVQQTPYIFTYSKDLDFNLVISQMLKGVDISLVDPQIYPHIESRIYFFIDSYKQQQDTQALAKLEFFLKYIHAEPRRREVAQTIPKPRQQPPPKPPVLTPEQVKSEVDTILSTDKVKLYNQQELELITAELRQRRADFIAQHDYLNAQRAEQYVVAVLSYGQFGAVERMQNAKADDYKTKLSEAQEALEAHKLKWDESLQKLKDDRESDLQTLKSKYDANVEEVTALFDTSPPANMSKPSPYLLDLRKREDYMVSVHQFSQAKEVHELAIAQEEAEEAEHLKAWHDLLSQRLVVIHSNYAKQQNARIKYWDRMEEEMKQKADQEIEKDQKAIDHLQKAVKNAKSQAATASSLKKNSVAKGSKKGILPPLTTKKTEASTQAMNYRQRAILNSQIYTMKPGMA